MQRLKWKKRNTTEKRMGENKGKIGSKRANKCDMRENKRQKGCVKNKDGRQKDEGKLSFWKGAGIFSSGKI
jgi:hypothetical protein